MKINLDGTFHLSQGENFPFICPCDGYPIEFDPLLLFVRCPLCNYLGYKDEFYNKFNV